MGEEDARADCIKGSEGGGGGREGAEIGVDDNEVEVTVVKEGRRGLSNYNDLSRSEKGRNGDGKMKRGEVR